MNFESKIWSTVKLENNFIFRSFFCLLNKLSTFWKLFKLKIDTKKNNKEAGKKFFETIFKL